MHTYNRIVIATGAPPANQRYLIQFTVTGYADKAAEEAPDIEAIIKGFNVAVPKAPPPRRGHSTQFDKSSLGWSP